VDCPHIPEIGYGEFGRRLKEKIAGRRIPISGSVELTFRCNLHCAHCYAAGGNNPTATRQELTAGEWQRIFDETADEGCLWLLLTGGEPLTRPDFADLYLYAKRKGFLPTLFTNGTLLTPRMADFLAEWRPFVVEITLYGRTQATYERVTGVPGSHARCLRGIELLLERGIPFRLKTMLLTLNQHELWDIKAYAEGLGVQFRFDPLVNAGLDGARRPTALRLPPEEILKFEMADAPRWADWRDFWQRSRDMRSDPSHLYTCGAGLRSFHIDPYGRLGVCMMARAQTYDLRQGTFRTGWHDFLYEVRNQPATKDYRCHQCPLLALCGQCPGWGCLEHGEPGEPVEFLCRLAHLRAEALEPGVQARLSDSARFRAPVTLFMGGEEG
jgi:radical SAM protein with 4Fe4S-binding SPASM domain